jgi:hypothetical protein
LLDRFLADAIVIFHLLFITFAVGGGLLVLKWRRVMWLHLPAVAWAVLVELMSWNCPLTSLENRYRTLGGEAGYPGGFVEHYIWPVIYPEGLTDRVQIMIGTFVFCVNALTYAAVLTRWRRRRAAATMVEVGSTEQALAR